MKRNERYAAKISGEKTYNTGKPCKHGHMSDRRASTGICLECSKSYHIKYAKDNPEKLKANSAKYAKDNPEKLKANSAKHTKANPEKVKARLAKWNKENPEKVKAKEAKYAKANPEKILAKTAKARAKREKRIVAWADHLKIQAVYDELQYLNQTTDTAHHVDHIIPLNGKLVSGLHVHDNLQILTKEENIAKSNKYEIL